MTCEFTTFETNLNPTRNALVDDIGSYLHDDCTTRYTNDAFQYLKMAMDMDVIVPLGQDDVVQNDFGNYAEIVIGDRIWYYFITKCEWINPDCVKLTLSIDSINTFRADLEWAPQTTIERQHGDRLCLASDNELYRLIDLEPENISVLKHRIGKTKLFQNNKNINWYLIYDSTASDQPVRCRCIADQALVISKTGGGASQTLAASDLPQGQYNYVLAADNPSGKLTLPCITEVYNNTSKTINDVDLTIGEEFIVLRPNYATQYGTTYINSLTEYIYEFAGLKFVNDGNSNIQLVFYGINGHQGNTVGGLGSYYNPSKFCCVSYMDTVTTPTINTTSNPAASITIKELNFTRVTYDGNVPIEYAQQLITDTQVYNIGSQVTRSTLPFSQVDRTDTQLIKIINLPYAPCTVTYDSLTGVYSFPADWTYENGYMRLNDANLNAEFESKVKDVNLTYDLVCVGEAEYMRLPTSARNDEHESKLWNSQFHTLKLVYDSFSWELPLENFYFNDPSQIGGATYTSPLNLAITFKASNTMNSHFAFKAGVEDLVENNANLKDGCTYLYRGDFDEYVVTTRNNEESVFSSAYLDYIRNGYNYDKKVKAEQNAWNLAMAGVQLAGSIVSFAASGVTGGVSAAAGVALATSAIATFAGAAHNDQVANDQMNQKLKELALQGVNISGADDIDLLKYYSGNKAFWMEYEPDEYQKQALADLFHYCGYKHARHAIPNFNSRYWFNFIQCAPVFVHEATFVWNNYLDDIRARYRAGVTVYHRHEGVLSGTNYDWEQTHENWEVPLLNGQFSYDVYIQPGIGDIYEVTGALFNPQEAGDRIQFEWYWNAASWIAKTPDDTSAVNVASDGTFGNRNQMHSGLYIRARMSNSNTGVTYPWHIIWKHS